MILQSLGQILSAYEVASTPIIMQSLGIGTQLGIMAYSRGDESEADILGLEYMAAAGFKPEESIGLWKNMTAHGGQRPPEFLSTHPSTSTRISSLNANMKKAQVLYNQSKVKPNCG